MSDDRRRLRDLNTISEISLRLSSEFDLDTLFDLIVFYGSVLLEAQRATLLSVDPSTNFLKIARSHGFEVGETTESDFSEQALTVENVIGQEKEFIIVRRWQRAKFPVLDQALNAEAIMVPIPGKEDHVGVLIVEERLGKEGFSEYEAEVMQLLVAQAGIAIDNARIYDHLDQLVAERTKELETERDNSEKLLLNILPHEVCEELKERGRVTPRRYESTSILFTDFVGFTAYSEGKEPEELLDELQSCYSLFDEIVENNNLEKLKTIGDAYMCAGGLPAENTTHPEDCIRAGMQMAEVISSMGAVHEALGSKFWGVRIGIHTGPVVTGVVGTKKFAFDVWGATVNIASRMESNGVPGCVNVSQSTYDLTSNAFSFESRGKIEVKGGGPLNMYLASARQL